MNKCHKCNEEMTIEDGLNPSRYCNACAQEVAENLDKLIATTQIGTADVFIAMLEKLQQLDIEDLPLEGYTPFELQQAEKDIKYGIKISRTTIERIKNEFTKEIEKKGINLN